MTIRLKSQKNHRKVFNQTTNKRVEKVPNVKPYPIPDLEGQIARDFERKIRKPPTSVQKKVMREAAVIFSQTKKREQEV